MTSPEAPDLVARARLSAGERAAVEALAAQCNAAEGLDLKLSLGDGPEADPPGPTRFLYYAGGTLAGFCSLDGGMEVEVCGMVHPAHRHRGIGQALLAAAQAACNRRGVVELLLICEAASRSGQAFTRTVGGRLAFAEHHMELALPGPPVASPGPGTQNGGAALTLTLAGPAALDDLTAVMAAAFGDPPEVVRPRIAGDLALGGERYYLARQDGTPVGSLKIVPLAGRAGIYAFGVLPAYRGQGVGRRILLQTLALLRAEGWARAALEVETENAPALALYQRCGFQITTTYGYYALAL